MIWYKPKIVKPNPIGRYGHTLTKISETRFCLFGGKTLDDDFTGDLWYLDVIYIGKQGIYMYININKFFYINIFSILSKNIYQ